MTRLSGDTTTPPGRPRSQQIHDVDEDNEWLFSCRCESAKPVSTLLTCLRGTPALQPVTVFVSPSSITFHVYGTARQSQASVDLQAGLFSHYQVNRRSTANANANTNANSNGNSASASHPTTVTDATPNDSSQLQIPHEEWQHGGEFCVNLSTVLECLFVLGTHALEKTKLSMSYNIHTEIFKLELLEEGGVLSTAAIPGMVPPTHSHQDDDGGDSSLALAFRSTPIVARIILKSDFLRDALQEIDVVSGASTCSILLTPNKGLEFVTVGNQSDCVITIPATCSCISSFECATAGGGAGTSRTKQHHHHARSYPIISLQSAMRGLEFAEETCISINENGMIAIQHQILDTVGQGSPNFVDYIMTCLLNDDDESSATASAGRGTQERPTSSQGMSQSQSSSEHPYSLGWAVGNQITPGLSSQRNGGMKTTNPHSAIYDDDDDKENDDDDDGDLPPASTVQLFGTLDTESPSATLRNRSNSRRRRRRLVETENDDEENNNTNDDNDDGSQALLFGKNNDSEILLDVTALTSPPRRGRRVNPDEYDGSSSPELVFK